MAYDPKEPRDERGRWTVGGPGPHEAGPMMSISSHENADKADTIARIAAETAKSLDFDPKFITISDENKSFMLNGTERKYAGAAFLDMHTENPEIALYTPHVSPETASGVTAHEIEHQKYQAFINDYRKEREAMEQSTEYKESLPRWDGATKIDNGNDTFMRPDGTLHEPWASKYPVYTAWTETMRPSTQDYAKSDGVSGYSRDWWDAWHKSEANTEQAMHETLAEIAHARQKFRQNKEAHESNVRYIKEHGGEWTKEQEAEWRKNSKNTITHMVRKKNGMMTLRKGIDPIWNTLYNAVEANWKRRQKK